MTPITKEADPQVQAIFDALFAFMTAQTLPTANAWANQTGNGISFGISATTFDGASVSHTYFTPGAKVTVTPSSPELGPGATQQFTATATDADGGALAGATFTWKLAAGSPGAVDASGLYTAPAAIPNQTTALLTASLADLSAWAQIVITLHP